MAAAVTVTDIILAFPIAYYAARIAKPRVRSILLLAVVMPLWSNYLVRVFAWRVITAGDGPLQAFLRSSGSITASRPATGRCGSRSATSGCRSPSCRSTGRSNVSRIRCSRRRAISARATVSPSAGWWFRSSSQGSSPASIFTFSLTLGDYITPVLVGKSLFIGNAIYLQVSGLAGNLPFAAALTMIPIAIMVIYLSVARKLGAFEAL